MQLSKRATSCISINFTASIPEQKVKAPNFGLILPWNVSSSHSIETVFERRCAWERRGRWGVKKRKLEGEVKAWVCNDSSFLSQETSSAAFIFYSWRLHHLVPNNVWKCQMFSNSPLYDRHLPWQGVIELFPLRTLYEGKTSNYLQTFHIYIYGTAYEF